MGSAPQPSDQVVLVVDDEEALRRFMARALTDAGFRVLEARDGEEAGALLATLVPDRVGLVVSDIAMPGMTGAELAKMMTERWPTVPVLLISGEGTPPADYRGGFLPKPFLPGTLVAAVKALLPSMGSARGGQENARVPPRASASLWNPRLPIA